MIEKYLKNPVWSFGLTEAFHEELLDCFDEDKCRLTAEMAEALLMRNAPGDPDAAEELLCYAIEHYTRLTDENPKAKLYYLSGKICEMRADYAEAYRCYEKYTLLNTVNDGSASLLMRVLLLRDDFSYSGELDKLLTRSWGETDLGLRNDRLYEGIASYLVAAHENATERTETQRKRIKGILAGNDFAFLDPLIKRDDIPDELSVPEKVLCFARAITQEPATQESATQEPATQESATQESATQESATQESATQEPA